jgi:hypothetical protein
MRAGIAGMVLLGLIAGSASAQQPMKPTARPR